MRTKAQRWGNSLAVRIPSSFAKETGITWESPVELTIKEGALVITPDAVPDYSLGDLLEGVKKGNLPEEWETDPAVGKEVW